MASPLAARADRVRPKALFRLLLVALLLAVCLPLHLICRLFTHRSPWARLFLGLAGKAAGADVRIIGTPARGRVLFLSNHVSWLDILIIAGKTGSAFVAKADMAPWPVIGWLSTLNNSVYVQRENRHGAADQAAAVKAALETGQPLTLFPEGTTSNGLDLLPFRSSLIAAVTPPPEDVSIQPVALDYGPRAAEIAWVDDEPVGHNALRIMGLPGRMPITIHFLAPLDHADFADRKAIAAHSRAEIAAALFPERPA